MVEWDEHGVYEVRIKGKAPSLHLNERGDLDAEYSGQIIAVEQWGDINWKSMAFMFERSGINEIRAQDNPDLNNVTSMKGMFLYAEDYDVDLYNRTIEEWDTSNVNNMDRMFQGAEAFMYFGPEDKKINEIKRTRNRLKDRIDFYTGSLDEVNKTISDQKERLAELEGSGKQEEYTELRINLDKNIEQRNELLQDIKSDKREVEKLTEKIRELEEKSYKGLSEWCVEKIDQKPTSFDDGAGFEDAENLQPNWGEPC